jgi:hypothetical protein
MKNQWNNYDYSVLRFQLNNLPITNHLFFIWLVQKFKLLYLALGNLYYQIQIFWANFCIIMTNKTSVNCIRVYFGMKIHK